MSTLDLDKLHLDKGFHSSPASGHCLLEVVSMFADEPFTDSPACVSTVLQTYGTRLNDVLPDGRRQELKKYIPLLPGTVDDGLDERRSYLALDWLIRVYTPAWLRLVPALVSDADALAGFRPIDSLEAAAEVGELVRSAASKASAAWDAAGAAAWPAAGDAAGAAARDAARAAAGSTLQPTVDQLQQSAIELFGTLIAPPVVSG
jgi:hypothetical protein